MAQFFTDFSSDTVDALPSGWTLDGFTTGDVCKVIANAAARGGKELLVDVTTDARRTVIWSLPGQVVDAEMLVRLRVGGSTASVFPTFLRKSGDLAALKGYRAEVTYQDIVKIGRYNTTSTAFPETATKALYNYDQPTKYFYVRTRINGNVLSSRAWNSDAIEPTTWDVQRVDEHASAVLTAGAVGLFPYYALPVMYVDSVGVGTDGDSAPDAPVIPVVAAFSTSSRIGDAPFDIAFTDTGLGATSWLWDFGDGNTSTVQNPTHRYASVGLYSVGLTINGGQDSEVKANYIRVLDPAAPTVDGDFEGGNVNKVLSSIMPNGGDWTVNLVPRRQVNNYIAGTPSFWYFVFKHTNALGCRPTYTIDFTNWIGVGYGISKPNAAWRPCYSYTPEDPTSWVYASSVSWSGNVATWQFSTTFVQDAVFISYRPVMVNSMIRTWAEGLSGIRNLQGKNNLTVSTLSAKEDEAGRMIPAQDILGFAFGYGPAQVVLVSGIHPCEDHGTMVMMAFVESLLSNAAFCAAFTVFCYPCVNPQGRWGRSYRGTFDNGSTTDPARDWTDAPVTQCVQAVRADIVSRCAGGRPDIMLDFHGHFYTYPYSLFPYSPITTNYTVEQKYISAVQALQTGVDGTATNAAMQAAPYFSEKSGGSPAGAFIIVEISDWLADQYTAARAWGQLLAQQLTSIEDDVYGRWPIGTVGVLTAEAQSNNVLVEMSPVTNGSLYKVLRDGTTIRDYAPGVTYTDTTVEPDTEYTYTYQARNPGGATSISNGVTLTLSEIIGAWGLPRFGVSQPFGVVKFGVTPWS